MQGFGHGSYYVGDSHYKYVGHQQDNRTLRQENRTIQNVKPDYPVSWEEAAAPGHQ
jgi:hypothetical protein